VPTGNEEVVTLNPGPLIIKDNTALADTEALSVILSVKLDGPAVMGVPEIVPPKKLNPAGSDPLASDHVYGGDPPVALSVWEYATPTVPGGTEDVVIINAGALMRIDRAALAEPEPLSVTLTVKLEGPAAAGVPEMVPPERLSAAGRDPVATAQVYGGVPPVAFSVCEYPTPTVPDGNEEVLMPNAGALMIRDRAVLAEPEALSVTLTVKLDDPAAVGVPEIVPPERLSPAGSDPVAMDQV
jgi:hypothetical protein